MNNQQINIPKLRFPEFEDSWTNEKMGKLFSFKVTNSFSRENLNYEVGSVKNIHYGDIHKNFHSLFDITKESVPFINPEIAIERISKDNYCQEGDLILADASEDLADVGKSIELVNLNNENLLSGLHTILARPEKEKFRIGFIGYLFKSNWVRTLIQKESQGSKVLSISSTRLSNISLLFPSKEEQSRIASFFSAIDEKLKLETQRMAALKQYKKGVMQKLFSQELRFKDENGNEFPKWEIHNLTNLVRIEKGVQFNKEDLYSVGEYPCINGGVEPSGFTDKKNRKKNTITLSEGGNSCGYVNFIKTSFWCGGHCYTIEPNDNIDNLYLYQILKYYESEIMSLRVGSGLPNIQKKDLLSFKLNISISKNEQTKIANFLSVIDDKIDQAEKRLQRIQMYKKGLLQQMFV